MYSETASLSAIARGLKGAANRRLRMLRLCIPIFATRRNHSVREICRTDNARYMLRN